MSSATETTLNTVSAPAWTTATAPVVVTADTVLAEQLTISADPVSGTSVRVYGTRVSGSTLTVACATATPGVISYPGATSWECLISGLDPQNTVTVSDGTGTAEVMIIVPVALIRHRSTGVVVLLKHSASGVETPVKQS